MYNICKKYEKNKLTVCSIDGNLIKLSQEAAQLGEKEIYKKRKKLLTKWYESNILIKLSQKDRRATK